MKSNKLSIVLSLLVLASMLLTACQPAAATEAPVEEKAPTEAAAAPTEAPVEEPATEAAAVELMTVTNASCGEGDIIKEMKAVDEYTVEFTLCKPFPAFLAVAAFGPFAIQPKEWIEKTGGGGEILEKPVGTGPYVLDKWERGDSITYTAFADYWGEKAKTPTAVIRWATESATRLLELQSGTVHEIAFIGSEDFEVVQNDANLQLLPQANPNIFYVGMTNTFEPFDDVLVRQAIAYGIDRQRIVDNFLPAGSTVASHFTPCEVPGACDGEDWYAFDAAKGKELLAQAGFPDGFKTKLYYRDVVRTYLPEPGVVAVEIQTQLKENLNIDAEVVVMESGEFIDESSSGRLDGLYMLGWGADYMHITNFLDYHFSRNNVQFGTPFAEIYEPLEKASTLVDYGDLYTEANNQIKALVPMIPISHAAAGWAALANLEGANVPPFGAQLLSLMKPADGDTVVFMQAAEPISLYCMDETDGESLSACRQVLEGLYNYNVEGKAEPALATEYTASEDATVWTFKLRQGVLFHDGSTFDANDVIASWAAGLDASSPYHVGNTGAFEYPSNLFGLLND